MQTLPGHEQRDRAGPVPPPAAVVPARTVGTLIPLDGSEPIPLSRDLLTSAEGLVIGRGRELCHVEIRHPQVSRRHLRLRLVDGAIRVEDLNSTRARRWMRIGWNLSGRCGCAPASGCGSQPFRISSNHDYARDAQNERWVSKSAMGTEPTLEHRSPSNCGPNRYAGNDADEAQHGPTQKFRPI